MTTEELVISDINTRDLTIDGDRMVLTPQKDGKILCDITLFKTKEKLSYIGNNASELVSSVILLLAFRELNKK